MNPRRGSLTRYSRFSAIRTLMRSAILRARAGSAIRLTFLQVVCVLRAATVVATREEGPAGPASLDGAAQAPPRSPLTCWPVRRGAPSVRREGRAGWCPDHTSRAHAGGPRVREPAAHR